jgi:recombination protein U
MATWNSRGLRGSTLEDLINRTNEKYEQSHLALIQKIPTPITPVKLDKESHQITLAYFEQQSTVDYIGVVQGIPVCFDAKECKSDTFPLSNIHEHQVYFMEEFERQKGVAFILIEYTDRQMYYYLTFRQLKIFWQRMMDGGRKSFRLDELDMSYEIKQKPGIFIPYIDYIQKDLDNRDNLEGRS